MIQAVTIDFHNTIARCDAWFDLEVYDLIPAFFEWNEAQHGVTIDPCKVVEGKNYYRTLRANVLDSGTEIDAASSIDLVLRRIEVWFDDLDIEAALASIFQPTLDGCQPMPGSVSTIQELHAAGIPLAVVSSAAYHPFLLWSLSKFGVESCFVEVLTSASTGHYKSTTKIYELALEILNVSPQNCVHIGDSERFDVIPASSLGMRTVHYAPQSQRSPHSNRADLHVESLENLTDVLDTEFGLSREI
jgi:HAD superfamily hydrolase (TIGR01509 family)